jgi:hypothetical protein
MSSFRVVNEYVRYNIGKWCVNDKRRLFDYSSSEFQLVVDSTGNCWEEIRFERLILKLVRFTHRISFDGPNKQYTWANARSRVFTMMFCAELVSCDVDATADVCDLFTCLLLFSETTCNVNICVSFTRKPMTAYNRHDL